MRENNFKMQPKESNTVKMEALEYSSRGRNRRKSGLIHEENNYDDDDKFEGKPRKSLDTVSGNDLSLHCCTNLENKPSTLGIYFRNSGLETRDYDRRGSAALTMRHPSILKSWH
jgi:hypothetical protein